ncbi:putative ORFan [Tupanvirus deep ocean]|uniref:ORFan n=1 Tax=Tupanvirus soda lake TaxID=2126985 RepID=A0A2K9L423_9VIRU|nr:putative ORFan [Tupanvirus deep ocean]AUL79715.2 putative ORFan [Tupanvirus deep ocean]
MGAVNSVTSAETRLENIKSGRNFIVAADGNDLHFNNVQCGGNFIIKGKGTRNIYLTGDVAVKGNIICENGGCNLYINCKNFTSCSIVDFNDVKMQ